jgi:hypothetical protein
LLTSTKKGLSTSKFQCHLGYKRYEPIWKMLHKLRVVMAKCNEQHTLSGVIEIDEGFFSTETSNQDKDKPLKKAIETRKRVKFLSW